MNQGAEEEEEEEEVTSRQTDRGVSDRMEVNHAGGGGWRGR